MYHAIFYGYSSSTQIVTQVTHQFKFQKCNMTCNIMNGNSKTPNKVFYQQLSEFDVSDLTVITVIITLISLFLRYASHD